MGVRLVLEVKTLSRLHDTDGFLMSLVLENQLLQEEEGPLVDYPLADLDLTGPSVRCPRLLTIVALSIGNHKFNAKSLLKHRVILHFLLDSQLKLDSPRMGLRPNEFSIE